MITINYYPTIQDILTEQSLGYWYNFTYNSQNILSILPLNTQITIPNTQMSSVTTF